MQHFSTTDHPSVVIYGAGSHGRVVLDIASRLGVKIGFFLDDDASRPSLEGIPVVGPQEPDWSKLPRFTFLIAIGNNVARRRAYEQLRSLGGEPMTLVHPFSSVSASAVVGSGVSSCAGVVIGPGAQVEDNCIINTAASVDHDCTVGAHSHICPGVRLAGNVWIGERTMVGTGASVLPGVRIGAGCQIGAGAVVHRDLPPEVVAYGVPARIRRAATDGFAAPASLK